MNGMFFCSIMTARTEKGRQRTSTPLDFATSSRRIAVR
jgi:hypothetical protein